MNSEIKQILSNLVVENKTVDVSHLRYKGEKKTFVVWAIIDEEPALCGNDTDIFSIVTIDINIYSDRNYSSIMREINRRFINAGWVWRENSAEMYEEDTQLYHRVMTFEKEKEL